MAHYRAALGRVPAVPEIPFVPDDPSVRIVRGGCIEDERRADLSEGTRGREGRGGRGVHVQGGGRTVPPGEGVRHGQGERVPTAPRLVCGNVAVIGRLGRPV